MEDAGRRKTLEGAGRRWKAQALETTGREGTGRRWRRKARKALAKASQSDEMDVRCHGAVQRWVWASPWLWLPHWRSMEAEVRGGLLLLRPREKRGDAHAGIGSVAAGGHRATALPLSGASIEEASQQHKQQFSAAAGALDEF